MEKSRETRRFSQSNRLLICVLFLFLLNTVSIFAHRYSYAVFRPIEEYVFAGEDSVFETVIHNIRPADILVTVQTLPENVTFVSSEKTEIFDENGRSTRIRIILHFDTVGKFNLPAVASRIRYGSYKLSIAPVNVLYNPQTIQPIVRFSVLNPENEIFYEGQGIKLKLSVLFASNVYGYTTSLREDSVFYSKEDLVSLPLQIEKFSDSEYPIGVFEIIPLLNGKIQVPQVCVNVKTWRGLEKDCFSEPFFLNVKPLPKENFNNETSVKQFVQEESFQNNQNTSVVSKIPSESQRESVIKLRELRLQERNKIFPIASIKERKEIEFNCGLKNTPNELSKSILYILLIILAIFVVLCVIFTILHKKTQMIIFIVFFLIMLIIIGVYKVQLNKDYALVLHGEILSIPEETSSVNINLNPGFRVEVKGETKDWIYIKYGNSSGWIKRENLLFF